MLIKLNPIWGYFCISDHNLILKIVTEIHMVKNRQKGITKAYRNDKKDVDTLEVGRFVSDIMSPGNRALTTARKNVPTNAACIKKITFYGNSNEYCPS